MANCTARPAVAPYRRGGERAILQVEFDRLLRAEVDTIEEGWGVGGGAGVRLGDDAAGAVRW